MTGKPQKKNPWLQISALDYEGHMSSPFVGQHQLLNDIFKDLLISLKPECVAVLGCATGNGFEHVDWNITNKLIGFDINPKYLRIVGERYPNDKYKIELRCCDISSCQLGKNEFDLIHCGLIFEYVSLKPALINIFNALKDMGIMSVILQLPNKELSSVSETKYSSLEKLTPIMNLLNKKEFIEESKREGFREIEGRVITIKNGKEFYFGQFRKISLNG